MEQAIIAFRTAIPAIVDELTDRLIAEQIQPYASLPRDRLHQLSSGVVSAVEHDLADDSTDHFSSYWDTIASTRAEQGGQIGRLMANFPPEVMARTLPWMITHLDPEDRVAYVGVIQKIMPPERFGIACGWIRAGVAADLWSAIAARVPGCPA